MRDAKGIFHYFGNPPPALLRSWRLFLVCLIVEGNFFNLWFLGGN
jgi:hypothetical protein